MNRKQLTANASVLIELIETAYPGIEPYDPTRSRVPYVPDDDSMKGKASYALFTLYRALHRQTTSSPNGDREWCHHLRRQLRFVEGLLWGAGITSVSRLMDISDKIDAEVVEA